MNDEFVRVTELSHVAPGTGKIFRVHGRPIALFRINGSMYALDNACPHRDGPLGEGLVQGSVVTCPRHGWQFDVTTGACVGRPGRKAFSFPTRIEGDMVLVQLPAASQAEAGAEVVRHALVRFGAMGYVGRFRSQQPLALVRGSRVVVESSRGMEIGEVLWSGAADSELVQNQPDSGVVLREITESDAVTEKLLRDRVRPAFEACRQLLDDRQVPVELIDAEQLLDGQTIIFYFLGDPPPALADITAELTGRFEAHVQFRPFGDRLDDCGACGHDAEHGCGQCSEDGTCGQDRDDHGCGTRESAADSP
jgi:nitrite reductase/ring-hydroxylating ferredoxin subunit